MVVIATMDDAALVAVAWSHASVSAFLLRGVQREVMLGLSGQTLLAMACSAVLTVAKKLYFPITADLIHLKPLAEDAEWYPETAGWVVDTVLLLCCTRLFLQQRVSAKSALNDKELNDDFGRRQTRSLWFTMSRQQRPPPTYLHWSLIYIAAALLAFLSAWGQVGFDLSALGKWAAERPTAMIAIFVNFLRGLALLPQLHMSHRTGHVAPGLALWIAMMGSVDMIEFINDLVADGFVLSDACYCIGDAITFLLVSDFLWLFIKSRARGRTAVEMPMVDV